jgi:hypothetical protein
MCILGVLLSERVGWGGGFRHSEELFSKNVDVDAVHILEIDFCKNGQGGCVCLGNIFSQKVGTDGVLDILGTRFSDRCVGKGMLPIFQLGF